MTTVLQMSQTILCRWLDGGGWATPIWQVLCGRLIYFIASLCHFLCRHRSSCSALKIARIINNAHGAHKLLVVAQSFGPSPVGWPGSRPRFHFRYHPGAAFEWRVQGIKYVECSLNFNFHFAHWFCLNVRSNDLCPTFLRKLCSRLGQSCPSAFFFCFVRLLGQCKAFAYFRLYMV